MWKKWNEISPIPVRLVVGGGLAYHGFPKLFTSEGHTSFVHIMQGFGVPFPQLAAWLVGILEFFGGVALITGAFVVTASLLIFIELTINVVMATLQGGFPVPLNPNQPLPGYESSFLYMAGTLALFIGGSGRCSLTRMFVPTPTL